MSIQTVEIALPSGITIVEIRQGPAGPSGAGEWGDIGGTITDQADLVSYIGTRLASGEATAKNVEVFVRNVTGATIAKGSIVYINDASGQRPTIAKAQANNDANSAQTIGFVKADIANNGTGYVITSGDLENVNTQALAAGQQLYLSPETAGAWTTDKPSAPQHLVYVGIVVSAHPTHGIIYVSIQNGYELDELHNVAITSPSTGQVLRYNATTGLWSNQTLAIGTTAGVPIITGTSGVLQAGAFGNSAGTFTQGNDSRLSDERIPTAGGIAAKTYFAPEETSLIDGDLLPLTGANITLSKTTLATLFSFVRTKLGLMTGAVQAAGEWAFSSPIRPTSAGTGTPAANSLITRADGDARYGQTQYVVQINDFSISNTTTPTDTDLSVQLEANSIYIIESHCDFVMGSTTPGAWEDALYTGSIVRQGGYRGTTNNLNNANVTRFFENGALDQNALTNTTRGLTRRFGTLFTSTAGTYKIQIYQFASSPDTTTIKSGSYLKVTKLP